MIARRNRSGIARLNAMGCCLLLAACSSSSPTPRELPTCGASTPVQLLPASPGAHVRVLGVAGDRLVVWVGDSEVVSVGTCGEDPQSLPEPVVFSGPYPDEVQVDEAGAWIVQDLRVGYWPVEGGAVQWLTDGDAPLGLVRGAGFVVVDQVTALGRLIATEGTATPLLGPVTIDTTLEVDRTFQFQVLDGVVGVADDAGKLQVVDLADPTTPFVVEGVGSFALAPKDERRVPGGVDGSYVYTRQGSSYSYMGDTEASFHSLDGAEPIPLGPSLVWPGELHPSGWLSLYGQFASIRGVFDPRARRIVEMPGEVRSVQHWDLEGRIYQGNAGEALFRFDPFSGVVEAVGQMPEEHFLQEISEDAALTSRKNRAEHGFFADADVTVIPTDGGEPWTLPERVESATLVPAGVVWLRSGGETRAEVGSLRFTDPSGDTAELHPAAAIGTADVTRLPGSVLFVVEDADHSGLWRADLP